MYSSVHSSSVTPQHSASSTLLFNLVMINWFCYRDCGFFSINFSPQRQAPGQCHGHFQMMEWNVSHIFPPAVAQQCSAPLFQPFKKTRFWGPNGDLKTEKGPHGDPFEKCHLGTFLSLWVSIWGSRTREKSVQSCRPFDYLWSKNKLQWISCQFALALISVLQNVLLQRISLQAGQWGFIEYRPPKKKPNIDQISTTQHFIDQISTAKVT